MLAMLLLLAAHLVLTALPLIAGALLAARLGVRSVPILLAVGLAVSAGLAMLDFWAYYGDQLLGDTISYLICFGSALAIAWLLVEGRLDHELLRQLATPLVLWALASLFLLFFGFLHGGDDQPLQTAAVRFFATLPSDNAIPRFFAEVFYENGHSGHPVFPPDWLASDRPPLQSGYLLSQHIFGLGFSDRTYQALAVPLQQLWVVGLWALLLAARVGRLTRALVMLTLLVSDVAIVNGFYVWPKMLPAALLLAAAALLLTPLWEKLRREPWAGALVAALFALAFLAHGGSIFGIVPLAAIALVRGIPSWRWLAVAVLAAIVLYAPWSAYQRYGEPPGNRLLKYQLAGVTEIDKRGTLETIVDAYEEAGLSGTLHNKGRNFATMVGGAPAAEKLSAAIDDIGDGDLTSLLREIRWILFYYLLPSLGLLLVAPVLMAVGRARGPSHPREWELALSSFLALVVGAVVWGLVMFGTEASWTVLHQGSFLLPVLGFCGAVCGLRATFPRFAVWFTALAGLLMFAVYVPDVDPLPETSFSLLAALLGAVGLAGFAVTVLRGVSAGEVAASPSAAEP